jgi:hypothetical protein
MNPASRARYRVDVSGRRKPGWRERRTLLKAVLAAVIVLVFLGRFIPPGPRLALELGLRWLLGLSWLGLAVLAWRVPMKVWRVPGWLVLGAAAAWFLARAFLKTQAALAVA